MIKTIQITVTAASLAIGLGVIAHADSNTNTTREIAPAFAELGALPNRAGPRPVTTNGVPHVQIGAAAAPQISSELVRRVSTMPGVETGGTVVSLPGATGFWVRRGIKLARPEAIVRGREFAHVHPDGSLHASLAPNLANKAVASGWAIHHPWANQRPGWEGFVMIYTPRSMAELEVVYGLVVASYSYVTGQDR